MSQHGGRGSHPLPRPPWPTASVKSMTPRIRVAGTPYERGRQYGTQARDRVRLSVAGLPARVRALRGVGLAGRPPGGGRVRGAHRRLPSGLPGRDARHRRRRRARPSRRAGHQRADRGDVRGQGPPGPAGRPALRSLPAECSAFAVVPAPGDRPDRHASRPELGLAAPLGPDAGRAGGQAGRRPGLRHRGRGGPAGQGRAERRGPGAGHQRPGHRRGPGRARASVPRAAAGHPGLRDRHRSAQGPPGRDAVLVGQLPDRPRQRGRARRGGRAGRLYPTVPAASRGWTAPAHQPLPVAAPAPGRRVAVGHAGQRGPPATAPGRRDRVRHARRPPRAARRSRRPPAQHLLPPRSARAPARAGRHHRFGPDGPERPAAVARRRATPAGPRTRNWTSAGWARPPRPAPRSSGTS